MRSLLRVAFVVSLLLMASSAFAIDFPCADNETNCSGEAPPTDVGGNGYGSGTNFKPPSTETCSARRSRNQACRECMPVPAPGGQWEGYLSCQFVTWSAGCSCKGDGTDACQKQASCTYIFD